MTSALAGGRAAPWRAGAALGAARAEGGPAPTEPTCAHLRPAAPTCALWPRQGAGSECTRRAGPSTGKMPGRETLSGVASHDTHGVA